MFKLQYDEVEIDLNLNPKTLFATFDRQKIKFLWNSCQVAQNVTFVDKQSGQIGALLRVLRATYSTLFSIPPFFAGHTPSNHYSNSNIRGKKSE